MEDRVSTERRKDFFGLRSGDVAFVEDLGRELRTRYAIACDAWNAVSTLVNWTEGTREGGRYGCLLRRAETRLLLRTAMDELCHLLCEETLRATRLG